MPGELPTIAQLECFIIYGRAGNFARAAQEAHITQSAFSAQIKHLEENLGGTLIHQSKRGSYLTEEGKLSLSNFLEPRVMGISIVGFFVAVCYSSVLSFLATYAAELHLMTAGTLFFVVYALSITVARPIAGVMFDRKGEDFVMYPTYACLAIGLLVLSITSRSWEMLAAGVFVGLGYGTFMSNGQAICVKLVEEVRIGVAVSTYFVMLDLGLGVGPYILGAFKEPLGFQGIYSAVGLGAIGCAVLYYVLYARRRKKNREEAMEELEEA